MLVSGEGHAKQEEKYSVGSAGRSTERPAIAHRKARESADVWQETVNACSLGVPVIGGTRIDLSEFREGWLLIGFGKAHFYRRDGVAFRPICGASQPPMLRDQKGFFASEPGGFPRCKKCLAAAAHVGSPGTGSATVSPS